jgi:hypothetical protein
MLRHGWTVEAWHVRFAIGSTKIYARATRGPADTFDRLEILVVAQHLLQLSMHPIDNSAKRFLALPRPFRTHEYRWHGKGWSL